VISNYMLTVSNSTHVSNLDMSDVQNELVVSLTVQTAAGT